MPRRSGGGRVEGTVHARAVHETRVANTTHVRAQACRSGNLLPPATTINDTSGSIATGSKNVSVSRLALDGGLAGLYGLEGPGVSRVNVDQVTVRAAGRDGIYLQCLGGSVYDSELTVTRWEAADSVGVGIHLVDACRPCASTTRPMATPKGLPSTRAQTRCWRTLGQALAPPRASPWPARAAARSSATSARQTRGHRERRHHLEHLQLLRRQRFPRWHDWVLDGPPGQRAVWQHVCRRGGHAAFDRGRFGHESDHLDGHLPDWIRP